MMAMTMEAWDVVYQRVERPKKRVTRSWSRRHYTRWAERRCESKVWGSELGFERGGKSFVLRSHIPHMSIKCIAVGSDGLIRQ